MNRRDNQKQQDQPADPKGGARCQARVPISDRG